jgi:hypothetical protein
MPVINAVFGTVLRTSLIQRHGLPEVHYHPRCAFTETGP